MTSEKADSFIKGNKLKNPSSRVYCVDKNKYLIINDNEIYINDKCVFNARPEDGLLTSLALPQILSIILSRHIYPIG